MSLVLHDGRTGSFWGLGPAAPLRLPLSQLYGLVAERSGPVLPPRVHYFAVYPKSA